MKLEISNQNFKYISDNSTECNNQVAFLVTKSSKQYIEDARTKTNYILTVDDLIKIIDITNIKIIAVTGTNGKTTTSAGIYSILLDLGYKVAFQGTRGFYINDKKIEYKSLTTPQVLNNFYHILEAKKNGCEFFIMEVSSHGIEQNRIEGLDFTLKIHTNITSDHLDYHKNLQNYIDIKNSFFKDETMKLINKDDKNIQFNYKNSYTYSMDEASVFKVIGYSLKDSLGFVLKSFDEVVEVFSPMFGMFNIYNLTASISAVKLLTDKPLQEIVNEVDNFAGVSGRVEVLSRKPLIIIDFAHTEDGMKQIFNTFIDKNISVVFGAGGDRDISKRKIMGLLANRYANKIYLTNDNPRNEKPENIIQDILDGIDASRDKDTKIILDRKKAIKLAIDELDKEDVLLILGKGDEEYQIFKNNKIEFSDKKIVEEYI